MDNYSSKNDGFKRKLPHLWGFWRKQTALRSGFRANLFSPVLPQAAGTMGEQALAANALPPGTEQGRKAEKR